MSSEPLKASVVINTFNRAAYLRNAIVSIAAQSYPQLELVVVNGPSTDDTEEVLGELEREGYAFKLAHCPNRNLSESRNVGISTSAGDVVLFIDDDAVAHRDWVSRLMSRYSDPGVGAAGGFTFDHTGMSYQCRYTVCDKFGNARFFDSIDPETALGNSSDFFFPSLLGTNCSFSRRALERIGGFDEVFEYMLDETDVCARVIASAKRVVTVPDAYVFHKYAPSSTRSSERIPTSLLAPARSKAYFCFKHSAANRENLRMIDVMAKLERYRKDLDFSNKWFLDHKKISPAHYDRISSEVSAGITDGMRIAIANQADSPPRGANQRPLVPAASVHQGFSRVHRFPRDTVPLKLYLVSQGYPPDDTAGIARWTHECAQHLKRRGHEVHVVTRSQTQGSHVDCRDGVWVHAVVDAFDEDIPYEPLPLPASIARRATAVLREIQRAESIWGVDVVSAPIWDVEGILCCTHLRKPVITSLHTTYKLAMPFKNDWRTDAVYVARHVNKVIAAESWLLQHSSAILANSGQVIEAIENAYDGVLSRTGVRITTIPHGLGSPVQLPPKAGGADPEARETRMLKVLFVGRLEERKGPDFLLSALAHLPLRLPEFEVVFVGDAGPERGDYARKIGVQVEALRRKGTRANLRFLGHVSDAEVEQHYRDADIFVAPSRFESFGLTLIEAMRFSTPVIASDVGGMREIIRDGIDGYLVNLDNTVQLAQRLSALLTSPELRRKIGEAARHTYETRYTAARMAESLESLYLSLTEEHTDE